MVVLGPNPARRFLLILCTDVDPQKWYRYRYLNGSGPHILDKTVIVSVGCWGTCHG
jgi:hypothetical protein